MLKLRVAGFAGNWNARSFPEVYGRILIFVPDTPLRCGVRVFP
jgi:hypothetical protein